MGQLHVFHRDPPSAPGSLRREYRTRLEPTARRRLVLVAALFVLFVGVVVVVECQVHPERRATVLAFYAIEVAAAVTAVAAARVVPATTVTAVMAAFLAVCLSLYNAVVRGELERVLVAQLTWLGGLVVVIPWGWREQLGVALASLASVVLAVPFLSSAVPVVFPFVALLNGVVTSVCGAFFLERYRVDAFVQMRWAREASAAHHEEADVSGALLHVSKTLSVHLDRPDVFERVTRLARTTVGCDWASIFIWHEHPRVYRLHANVGSRPEVRQALAAMEFPRDSLPLLGSLRAGELIEIPEAEGQALVPSDFMRRMDNASTLYAPIARGDEIIGVLACGYRERTGPFTRTQRRLALGIAHATAAALETVRLIGDLQTASRLKSEFVSTMSHELRTPLNVILGYVEMARDQAFDEAERDRLLLRTERAARELLDLVETTLDLGRIEAGRDDVRMQPVVFPDFWQAAAEQAARLPRAEAVRLDWDATAPALAVVTDPRKLGVVLRNLIANALKFTEQGRVQARAWVDGEALLIAVSDTGIGIAPADQHVVFDMFRQGDGSDSRRFGGVGLGLHIVRRFVEQLGGTVSLESVPGHGSTFTVRIPLATPLAA